ncbi:MAG: radical SAM protein [Clostridia bacterium]|nr:radical SAM protein [Clostridia bacterium]
MDLNIQNCKICPRECGANRTKTQGACGADEHMRVAKIMLHRYEEPPISGTKGSGAIFFCGCSLRCGYCQNAEISRGKIAGEIYSPSRLAAAALQLQSAGAHNINLITAGHYLPRVKEFLSIAKPKLHIPVVYNSSGYEKAEAVRELSGLVDIYLPDYKYVSADAAQKYSAAADYPEIAEKAIAEMVAQTGEYKEKDGLAVKGTVIRHLVLPSLSKDGVLIMQRISALFPAARVSVMSQYTPSFNRTGYGELNRKVTAMEYNRVLRAAQQLNLDGFMQSRDSASDFYTPEF